MADFDIENYEQYLTPKITAESQKKLDILEQRIRVDILNEKELKFIDDVKKRIRVNKNLTEKQKSWLAKILIKCRDSP